MEFILSPGALRDLEQLDRRTSDRVQTALRRLADEGRGDVVKLVGVAGTYRLRVGTWRVLFTYGDPVEIHVMRIQHRRDVYR